jgi:anti-sigma factor RsiW
MPHRLRCADVELDARELLAGELAPSRAAAVEAHAASCARCAAAVARERRLTQLLGALPDAPRFDLVPPALPRRPGLLVRMRVAWTAAAVAAAVLAAVGLLPLRGGPGHAGRGELRVVDVADGGSLAWDDGLLGLVAGAEAVASRRLVETR